jgi:hypothetical protein
MNAKCILICRAFSYGVIVGIVPYHWPIWNVQPAAKDSKILIIIDRAVLGFFTLNELVD